jgi:hypothetical protein
MNRMTVTGPRIDQGPNIYAPPQIARLALGPRHINLGGIAVERLFGRLAAMTDTRAPVSAAWARPAEKKPKPHHDENMHAITYKNKPNERQLRNTIGEIVDRSATRTSSQKSQAALLTATSASAGIAGGVRIAAESARSQYARDGLLALTNLRSTDHQIVTHLISSQSLQHQALAGVHALGPSSLPGAAAMAQTKMADVQRDPSSAPGSRVTHSAGQHGTIDRYGEAFSGMRAPNTSRTGAGSASLPGVRSMASPIREPIPERSPFAPGSVSVGGRSSDLSENDNGSSIGDLYLDGSVLGRWVIRHFERVLTRPTLGTTAMDPSVITPWPGLPITN